MVFCVIDANAQTYLKKAMSEFFNNGSLTEYFTSTKKESGDGYNCQNVYFSMPAKKKSYIDRIIKAFAHDKGEAYEIFEKAKGADEDKTVSVGIGKRSRESVGFGSYKDRNYKLMFFRDGDNDLKRSVYALVWKEDKKTIEGSVWMIYGDNPKKNTGNMTIYNYPSSFGTKSFSDSNYPFGSDSIKDSGRFLNRFGSYRSLYYSKNVGKDGNAFIRSSVISKIMNLCKDYSRVLDSDEKKIVKDELTEMKKNSGDSYQQKLLDLSIKYLK
jgi:hypothetical protein